jgi:two-component system CheB/CheR fusion protein
MVSPAVALGKSKPGPAQKKELTEKRIAGLESQLKESRDSIRIMTEDFESTREELQSANEEVLSSNEELQSINEEMETSKEELQSTNEELTTINEELRLRNAELKESGEYARAISEMMHESLLMLTSDLRIRTANKGFYKAFNLKPEDAEGLYLHEVADRQWDIPEITSNLQLLQSRDTQFTRFEITHSFPGQGVKTLRFNAQKFSLREGNDFMIMLAIQDHTEWKQMEDVLKGNEERFRILIQNASDIITVLDQDGTIKYESPASEIVLGYKADENIGKNINTDNMIHPEDRRLVRDLVQKSIANPRANIDGEFRVLHNDGAYRTIDAIFRNLLDDSKINGIIANYRDITDRKILEHHKDEFIAIASHELKTPVTSIKAYAQILEDTFLKAKDTKSAALLSKMNVQVDRLTTLIIDLLDFTRIEGGKLKFREEQYKINDLVNEVVEDMQRTTRQHTITKKLGENVKIKGDRYRTGQVITNLLNNAIKYSPDGKKIIVTTKKDKKNITVCVEDFGIGIDEYLQDKIFDRFYRITESSFNTISGLGVGLYIAAEFIKRQGGNIWVKSRKGKGSTFCFSLPIN